MLRSPAVSVGHDRSRVNDGTPDEILMVAYQAGNEAAFDQLFERYAGRVYGFLVRRLGDPSLAEDLYQEAFLRIHRARSTYDPTRPFRAWLFGIVHNLLADTLRSQRRMPQTGHVDGLADAQLADAEPGVVTQGTQSPERVASLRESSQALSRALHALPSEEATVLILARLEGLSYEDIGHVVGRTAAATKQLAYRALKRVRAAMVRSGHEEDV
jgi:RNA polymerase sigma-70 factor (ECF subfamily)